MHLLSPINYIKSRRARTKQTLTALQMLTVSGVVRPSHVELRYATPVASITAFRRQSTAIDHSQTRPIPVRSWKHNIAVNMEQTWRCACSLSSTLTHFAKKPIVLQWTKQLGG